jgi:hypothetical protein
MTHRFGKLSPKLDYRTLRFKKYVLSSLPAPPPSADTLARIYSNLGINDPTALFPLDGNGTYSDCTIAAMAHAITLNQGLLSKRNIMTEQDVLKVYFALSGGNDSGLYELDVLNYWQSNSAGGEQILAFASIDPKNHLHVQQAIQIFGSVYLGFQVQQACEQDFDSRTPWTPGPLTMSGHAVIATSYDAAGVTVLTWGNTQRGTWSWWDECVDEAYAILPVEAQDPAFCPGLDLVQLQADLKAVSN